MKRLEQVRLEAEGMAERLGLVLSSVAGSELEVYHLELHEPEKKPEPIGFAPEESRA